MPLALLGANAMEINKSLLLNPTQYVDEVHKKNLIILHHTVGGSAKSTADYWKNDPKRIGTAFIIERDGTIYQMFPEDRWAYHVGSKIGNDIDRRSIGIELASEGGLTENNGELYAFGIISQRTKFTGPTFDLGYNWRGFRYFDVYDEAQINSTIQLVAYLCDKYSIPKILPKNATDYEEKYYAHKGIMGHAHVRADKSDVHPGFPWNRL